MDGSQQGSRAETWDRAADSYDSERSDDTVYVDCLEVTRRSIEMLSPARLLDVGCGTGLTTLSVCRPGRFVAAADYSFHSLELLRTKSRTPAVMQADVCALPFPPNAFDVVLCANTLQHLGPERHPAAIAALRRLVRPDGALVVSVHHYSKAKQRAGWIKQGRPGQAGIDYIFRFSAGELQALLPTATIAAMGIAEWPRLPRVLQRWLPLTPAGSRLAHAGLGHMLIAVDRIR
jgi:ubiquinone/menaquinone biosynthesis C-methylase UbiE